MYLPAPAQLSTKPPSGARVDWSNPLSQGLVACFLFNEGAGSIANDISGNRLDATLTGHTWGGGNFFGPAPKFAGSAYWTTGNYFPGNMKFVTVEAWINTTESGTIFQICNRDSTVTSARRYWQFRQEGTNTLTFIVFNSVGGLASATGVTTINNGRWHHLVGTWDGATVRVYVDGKADASSAFAGTGLPAGNDFAFSKGSANSGGSAFAGSLDLMRIWGRALSAAEVRQLYLNPFCHVNQTSRRLWVLPSPKSGSAVWVASSNVAETGRLSASGQEAAAAAAGWSDAGKLLAAGNDTLLARAILSGGQAVTLTGRQPLTQPCNVGGGAIIAAVGKESPTVLSVWVNAGGLSASARRTLTQPAMAGGRCVVEVNGISGLGCPFGGTWPGRLGAAGTEHLLWACILPVSGSLSAGGKMGLTQRSSLLYSGRLSGVLKALAASPLFVPSAHVRTAGVFHLGIAFGGLFDLNFGRVDHQTVELALAVGDCVLSTLGVVALEEFGLGVATLLLVPLGVVTLEELVADVRN